MKFLFISKPMKYEFLGITYISRVLKDNGVDVKLHIIGQDDFEEIIKWHPDFIGASIMTGSQKDYLNFIQQLKKKFNFISVLGGPHPTYFPEIVNQSGIDYVCRGEGERGILKILQRPSESIVQEPLVSNLDEINFPDRDLLYQRKYFFDNPIRTFIASRGCPFNCPYCYNNTNLKLYKGQKWTRRRSVQNVIDEIKWMINNYPTKFVYFQDDLFILDRTWVLKFCEIYKKEIGLNFHCIIRLDLLDEEIAKALSEAGCVCVRCAAESGNDYIRQKVLKRRMTKEHIIKGTKLLRKYKIAFVLQNMLGLPQTSLRQDLETLKLNIKCRPTLGWSSIFQPYPGTELGDTFPGISVDDINENFYDNSILDISEKEQRLRLQKLFGFITQYPFLWPILPHLLDLKFDKLYKKLWLWNNKRADKVLYGGII